MDSRFGIFLPFFAVPRLQCGAALFHTVFGYILPPFYRGPDSAWNGSFSVEQIFHTVVCTIFYGALLAGLPPTRPR